LPTDTKHIYIITWSQLNHPSFAQLGLIDREHQTKPRKGV